MPALTYPTPRTGLEGSLAHRLARLLVDDGTRSLFDELLVPALNRAVALAEVHGVAMRIGNDLNLHVTRTADEFLEVDLVVAEGVGRLGARGDEHLLELLVVVCLAHALTTATSRCLDEHGVADFVGKRACLLDGIDGAIAAGHRGDAKLLHRRLCRRLVAERIDALGRRADEDDVVIGTGTGEIGVLRKEAIARMDGLRTGDLGGRDDIGDVEVRERGRRRADADALVCHLDSARVTICLRVHDDALDAELMCGTHDAQGDFATIGDENLVKHSRPEPFLLGGGLDVEHDGAELDGCGIVDADLAHDARLLGGNLVHELHGLDDAQRLACANRCALRHEGIGVGRRRGVEGADHRGGNGLPARRSRRSGSGCGSLRRSGVRSGLGHDGSRGVGSGCHAGVRM